MKHTIPWYYLLPAIVVLLIVSLYPAIFGAFTSFFDWYLGSKLSFVGLKNYGTLLSDKDFYKILFNTVYFALVAGGIEMTLGYYLAIQVDKLCFNTNIVRGFLMIPLLIAGIIVAFISKILLDPNIGIMSYLLSIIGIEHFPFYGSADTAMTTIIAVDTWWQTSFIFIIMLAGLQSIPQELLEAASLEGANDFQQFWRIKFPLLRNLFVAIAIFRLIDVLKIFDLVFGTTGGGPNLSTEVFQTFAYRTAFKSHSVGLSMAIIVLFSLFMITLCIIFNQFRNKEEL